MTEAGDEGGDVELGEVLHYLPPLSRSPTSLPPSPRLLISPILLPFFDPSPMLFPQPASSGNHPVHSTCPSLHSIPSLIGCTLLIGADIPGVNPYVGTQDPLANVHISSQLPQSQPFRLLLPGDSQVEVQPGATASQVASDMGHIVGLLPPFRMQLMQWGHHPPDSAPTGTGLEDYTADELAAEFGGSASQIPPPLPS